MDAVKGLNADLERVMGLMEGAGASLSERPETDVAVARVEGLAAELEKPALKLKQHGREIYDGVVEFGSRIERRLDTIGTTGDPDPIAAELLSELSRLAEVAGRSLDTYQALYSEISEMEQLLPALRVPVRNMRAGLRDLLDAQTIMLDWGKRAEALRAVDPTESS